MSTGSRFVLPYQTVIGTTGVPLNGALLFFYASGTSDPLDTYSDVNLTTPNTNPVVADAAGVFPNIFLSSDGYKVVLENSSDDQIWTADPVYGVGVESQTQLFNFTTTVLLLAAFGPGISLADGTQASTTGRDTEGDGGGARFYYNASDTTTADNGGTIRVDGQGRRWYLIFYGAVDISWFGAKGDGVTDCAAAFRNALTFAAGAQVNVGTGTYVIKSQVSYLVTTLFASAMRLQGAGQNKTIINCQVTGGVSCFYTGSNTANAFSLGGYIRGMTIKTTTASASPAIELKATFQFTVDNVDISGLASHGIQVTCLLGDSDAANIVLFRECRFENLGGAGIFHNFATSVTQPSFIRAENCEFSNCGLTSWYYIGLTGSMENCAITECGGGVGGAAGFWIVNNTAANAQFEANSCSFENNYFNSVRIDSLQGGIFLNCEIAENTIHPQTVGFNLTATSSLRMEGTRVRIDPTTNPYTAFALAASATGNTIADTFWQSFDATGQVRYNINAAAFANRILDLDAVQVGTSAGVSSITFANGLNNNVPLPLDGVVFGGLGPSGVYSVSGFAGGQDGRKLEYHNTTGQVLTLLANSGSSSVFNRIRTNGDANVTLNNDGTASFRYIAGLGWLLLGVG